MQSPENSLIIGGKLYNIVAYIASGIVFLRVRVLVAKSPEIIILCTASQLLCQTLLTLTIPAIGLTNNDDDDDNNKNDDDNDTTYNDNHNTMKECLFSCVKQFCQLFNLLHMYSKLLNKKVFKYNMKLTNLPSKPNFSFKITFKDKWNPSELLHYQVQCTCYGPICFPGFYKVTFSSDK